MRLDLFGEEVERIFEVDLATMASDRRLDRVELVGATVEAVLAADDAVQFAELLPRETIVILAEIAEILEQARGYFERVRDARSVVAPPRVMQALARRAHAVLDVNQFSAGANPDRSVVVPVSALPHFDDEIASALAELAALADSSDVFVLCENAGEATRTRELLSGPGGAPAPAASASRIAVVEHRLHRGFVFGEPASRNAAADPSSAAHSPEVSVRAGATEPNRRRPLVLVPQHELLHRYGTRRRTPTLAGGKAREAFLSIAPGDYVVHREHGIARFVALGMLPRAASDHGGRAAGGESDGSPDLAGEEVLTLEFEGGTRLHVPMARIDVVQKYIGAGNAKPTLSTIGGRRWKRQKEQAEDATRELAAEMLRVHAAREATQGIRFPDDTPWQREFEAEFPYDETEDQLAAIAASKRDMCSPRPMDRLVCGDVGFGKTEVAMRAAFKAVEHGKQVAVLVPTTVLAEQHERTFRERFRAYPFRIESLSRFKTGAEQDRILRELAAGRVDVVIGTHRLLSQDVRFADLGLVVVDEEQRFGVEHKTRLLQFRLTADVLTLSATPIPRTLHMAMLGLRDISSLTTPPLDRRAIVTEVIPFNPNRIRQALERELAREGQAFVVHNRVHDIQSFADDIQRLVPDARVIFGHGQMAAKELEDVMLRFMRRQADVLVCTTIIESGIDIPTANTMIINNGHMFGLAELHQLRGRVGRSKHRAYCYLLTPTDRPVTQDAMKRLRALEDHSMLGAGFRIAMRDLEIRGAGNLLGAEQSGHIAAVGYEMYCQLLEEAVGELKRQPLRTHSETQIDIGVRGAIPRGHVPSDQRRMEAYRRAAEASTREAIARIERDLASAYGDIPRSARALLELAELRVMAAELGIKSIARVDSDIVFRTTRPADLEARMKNAQGTLRVVGVGGGAAGSNAGLAEVYFRPPKAFLEPATLLAVLRRRLA
ncbi:MAG: transcription-repair coupling factor [Phycisphaerales bacterium]